MNHKSFLLKKPWGESNLLRLSWIIIICLAFTAGYCYLLFKTENLKYRRLEDRYVRVRGEIGREAMQDLIDASYK